MPFARGGMRRALVAILGLAVLAAPRAGAQDKPAKKDAEPPKKEAPALPASLAGFTDSGTFHIYKDEDRLVTIEFTWKPDGTYENKSALSFAGQTVNQSFTVTPDKDGRWEKVEMKSPAGDARLVRREGVAERTAKDKTTAIKLQANAVLFENYAPALISQAVRAYDRAKGGKQRISVFILQGVLIGASLEFQDEVERAVGGKDLKLRRYVYGLPGVDLTVWAGTADNKVYLVDVPSQRAHLVRAGYESLRKTEEKDPLLSRPEHPVKVERDVGVPMRDGVKLSTDIYRPEKDGKYPVILIRTPYKKEVSELSGRYYARRGYAVAVQNCRGRFGSEGSWEPFVHEPADGHDAVEWLAVQPWSSGKVGMIGGSYLGWVQWWAASQKPSHLVTLIPNVAPPDPFLNFPYENGVFFLWAAIWWADVVESGATADISGATLGKIMDKKYQQLLKDLPVVDLDKKVLGKENPYWRKWIDHPTQDAYWDPVSFSDKLADVRLPVFHQSGWFDGDGIGSKRNYLAMARHGHPHQKLVLGPWGHGDEATRFAAGRDFGPEAVPDLPRAYLRWFDRWLKGVDNGIDKEPLVSLFVMGANRWARGPAYPLPQTRFEKWYLASDGQANTSKGDGKLTREPPGADSPPDRYTYDPGDPTPEPAMYEEPEDKEKKVISAEEAKKKAEAYHEELTGKRRDILVYVSEPFKEPYTIAGPLSAVLYASTSARDTDWFLRLMEVDEKGRLFPLGSARMRARFRQSLSKPELLEPGKVYEYQLDLWQTGIRIPVGRRLRLEVASASFPLFSRNLNTGGHNEKETKHVSAEQTIHHSKEYPSHVLLPALPEEPKAKEGKKP
jgi:putative CocE/NonD family hydrolase